jgi:hypothetical protein
LPLDILYIQAFVEKAFCRICLLIISILVAQLILSIVFFQNLSFGIGALLLTVILWALIFSAVKYFNTFLKKKKRFKNPMPKI